MLRVFSYSTELLFSKTYMLHLKRVTRHTHLSKFINELPFVKKSYWQLAARQNTRIGEMSIVFGWSCTEKERDLRSPNERLCITHCCTQAYPLIHCCKIMKCLVILILTLYGVVLRSVRPWYMHMHMQIADTGA